MGGNEVGGGNYYKKDNLLILNYEKGELYNLSYHKASQSLSRNDSITYHFNVQNFHGEPISNTQIIYENFSSTKSDWFTLDENSNGSIKLDRASNDTIKYRFSYLGYNIYTINLRKDFNYYIDVFLANDGQDMPIDQHTEKFEIITSTNKVLKLKDDHGRINKWFKRNE